MEFGSVLETLHNASGLKIEVKWDLLQAAGIDRKTPITVRLLNVKVSKVLDVILASIGDHCHRLTWARAADKVVVTTTDDYIAHNTEEREYDIRDQLTRTGMTRSRIVRDIAMLVMDTVAPDSWIVAGGKPGFIFEKDGVMFITQTRENHRQIENLFEQLRETYPPRQAVPQDAAPPATQPRG